MLLPYSCGGSPAVRQASAAPQSQTEGLCAASAKQYHWPKSSVLWNGVLRVRRGHHFLLIPKKLPLVAAAALFLSGCLGYDGQVIHGYQLDPKSVEQVKAGDSAEHILVLLGSPTTTSTVGGDAWYYMTQITNRGLQFMQPKVTDQRVFAVYFTKDKKVERVANYGMEDGKLIDFVTRTTPTAGAESNFLKGMFINLMHF
jgi:outer membrane protein assembly factor BamE (lipoprotein component of BamABCDE complex)